MDAQHSVSLTTYWIKSNQKELSQKWPFLHPSSQLQLQTRQIDHLDLGADSIAGRREVKKTVECNDDIHISTLNKKIVLTSAINSKDNVP